MQTITSDLLSYRQDQSTITQSIADPSLNLDLTEHFVIPAWLLDLPGITPDYIRFYAVIERAIRLNGIDGWITFKREEIAEKLRCTTKSIDRFIAHSRKYRIILIEAEIAKRPSRFKLLTNPFNNFTNLQSKS